MNLTCSHDPLFLNPLISKKDKKAQSLGVMLLGERSHRGAVKTAAVLIDAPVFGSLLVRPEL